MADWPKVLANDIGVRPGTDVCAYCKQKVGDPHTTACATIMREVKMRYSFVVTARVPFSQTPAEILDRKNQGWCASYGVDEVVIAAREAGCACKMFSAEFIEEGPMVPIQHPGRRQRTVTIEAQPFRASILPNMMN